MSKEVHYSVHTLLYKDNKPTNLYVNCDGIKNDFEAIDIAESMLAQYNEYITEYNRENDSHYKCSVVIFKHDGDNYDIFWLKNSIHWMEGARYEKIPYLA